MTRRARARAAAIARYGWAAPGTVLGLALAAFALHRGQVAVVDGVIEAHGPLLDRLLRRVTWAGGGVAAVTLGHVVLGCDALTLELTREHERVHVRQYERWGPMFLPAYLAASAWARLSGGDAYFDNVFEVEARRRAGS